MTDATQPETTAVQRGDRAGTIAIIAGTAVSVLSVYLYQVIAGRTLGVEGFAPIGIIWTVSFLVSAVLNIPVEQYLTRRLTLSGGTWIPDRRAALTAATPLAAGMLIGVGFVAATLDRFFEGTAAFVAVTAALLVSRSVNTLGRGFLAGRRRFIAYGAVVARDGVALVVLAAGVAFVAPSTLAFAALLVMAPLLVLLARPFTVRVDMPLLQTEIPADSGFLGALVVATAASQIILAAGPIVVGFVGGSAAAVSVIFVTFTLFRGPVTSSSNLISRVLPDFTAMAAAGDDDRLNGWAERIGLAAPAAAVVFGVSAWFLGPVVVELLYGAEFAPTAQVAALAAAAVGFALASLFLNQVYVARGETGRQAVIWIVALVVAGYALFTFPGSPMERMAVAFIAGEASALLLLVATTVLGHRVGRSRA